MVYGTNAVVMKENNKRMILGFIRRGDYSRARLSRKTGLTKAAVSIIIDEMLNDRIVVEEEAENYTGIGRKPTYLRIRDNAKYVIGLELSRLGYKIGLFDLNGNVNQLESHKYSKNSVEDTLDDIVNIINNYKKVVPIKKLLGIGIATPGPIDCKNGIILNAPNFEEWHDCSVSSYISEKCGLPVLLENISNAMAVAEQYFGCCKNERDFAYILVDEGIGSGIVVDGKIYRSQRGFGNELGHISINFEGLGCACGNRGCLETYASIPAILKDTEYSDWSQVMEAEDADIINSEAEYLGYGLISLLNLLDLGTIVLGGDICYKGEIIAEYVSNFINERALVRHPVRVLSSKLDKNGALAAAAIAINDFFF